MLSQIEMKIIFVANPPNLTWTVTFKRPARINRKTYLTASLGSGRYDGTNTK